MSKKSTKALASAALMSLVLTTALSAGPVKAAQGKVTRVSGADRYATASQVATTNWESGSDSVVLVSGEGYADAVSASALAKKLGAPILLTEPGSLNADAQKALDTLKPKNVYVIGGNASISQSIRDGLKDKYTLTELGGANRYETNAAVADELVKLGVDASNVLVVGGEGFSDALSVAPVAAAKGQILLLAANDQAKTQPVIDFVKKNNSKATVVGTKNIINDTIYNALGASSRVDGGADRFATNIKVLTNFQGDLKSDKVYIANASKATPDNLYADALVASAVAGKYSAPLVLVDKDPSGSTTNPNATDNAIAYLKDNTTSSTDFQVIGGLGVVPQAIEDDINAIYNTGDATVASIEAQNLNQIKITFNTAIDTDSAEDVTNYKIDGTDLTALDSNDKAVDENGARAKAVDDHTVVLTLANKKDQFKDVAVTVKKGILTADKTKTIAEFEKDVTFSDTTAPTLDSVTVQGNTKLTVQFSEAVDFGKITLGTFANDIASKFKIDGQSIKNYGLDTPTVKSKLVDSNDHVWSNKVEFYFNSSLPTGNHTLKISDGDTNGILSDAAGFVFKETTNDFNVDENATDPSVKNVSVKPNGEIDVEFDRPMDTTTFNEKQWKLNNKTLDQYGFTKANDFDSDNNDTLIELKNLGNDINVGANTLYVDKNMKDAYGNKVPDDTNVNFNYAKDTTKPIVSSVDPIDSETIRVRFSKDVKYSYATDKSSYKLLDNKGYDVSSHIKDIESAKGASNTDDTDTYNIKIYKSNPSDSTENWSLTGSTYTITIKNIVDATPNANVMDDYTTTFTGVDTVAPKVSNVYANLGATTSDKDKAVVYFSKPMDPDSIADKTNYQYTTPNGDVKSLPTSATISAGGDNKSAIIELPTSYRVFNDYDSDGDDDRGTGFNVSDSNTLEYLTILNVTDEGGNTVSDKWKIVRPVTGTTTVKDNSIVVKHDGDDVKVDVQFNKAIDNLDKGDFTFAGVPADAASVNGSTVTLTFKDSVITSPNTISNAKVVKAAGVDGQLAIASTPLTTDESGATIAALTPSPLNIKQSQVYDYQIAPKTVDSENWKVVKNASGTTVIVPFDTKLDKNSGVKTDDFVFNYNGKDIKASGVTIPDKSNTVIFTLDPTDAAGITTSNKLAVRVKSAATASIRTATDRDNGNVYYTPSDDDIKDNYIDVIVDTTAPTAPVVNSVGSTDTAVTGTAEANSTVTVKDNAGKVLGTASADASGAYSVTIPIQATGTVLSVTATDAAGNVSPVQTQTVSS